ncbi:MAG: nucleotide-diphospho-sugar transferase [Cyanobacteria bacterium K_DeepCast_35m_m1_288]|nr:nucleotide-diphospho-sugar transferase [Cyanobacteria bacterium K_DeepCast_35m_m1_288]MBM5796849.1 nucleotide-diphospho-sugar transferase [Cyanobacteria bacterium K_Offshore_0m_m2_072]
MSFPVPVLLIAFNRPDCTARVMAVLAALQPQRLYVSCDGPRADRPGEAERCQAVRRLISSGPGGAISWPCQWQTLLREQNLGCRAAVSGALDWFFAQEEEGIVLEDDILPDPSFFPYCQELLARYCHDSRIGVIAANNHQRLPPADGCSYRFSQYSHCWGWASWRRAWLCYDRDLAGWPAFRDAGWLEQLGGAEFARRWGGWLERLAAGQIDTWDMVWQFSCWQQGFLTVIPAEELVENIGFTADATHTLDEPSPLGRRGCLSWPLVHPSVIQADRRRDADTFRRLYQRGRRAELARKARKVLRLMGWR